MSQTDEVWTKTLPIVDVKGVHREEHILREISLQQIASSYGFTPKILDVTKDDVNYYIHMEKIGTGCLADTHGDSPEDIPPNFWEQMRHILKLLYVEEGIEYIDITPYNFIEWDNTIYLIDFGHATFKHDGIPMNWFLKQFLYEETNEFNPDFR